MSHSYISVSTSYISTTNRQEHFPCQINIFFPFFMLLYNADGCMGIVAASDYYTSSLTLKAVNNIDINVKNYNRTPAVVVYGSMVVDCKNFNCDIENMAFGIIVYDEFAVNATDTVTFNYNIPSLIQTAKATITGARIVLNETGEHGKAFSYVDDLEINGSFIYNGNHIFSVRDNGEERCIVCGLKNIAVADLKDKINVGKVYYDGKEKKPVITIEGLTLNEDYIVCVEPQIAAYDAYTATIVGVGDYTGSVEVSWSIDNNGWIKLDGDWYYFEDGEMLTNWQEINGKWYFLDETGVMLKDWQEINSKWYYLGTNGVMQTGWQKLGTKWFYFNASGVMQTNWQKLSNKWYYFNASGAMQTGWVNIGGKDYYFYEDGSMAADTYIGKYYVDANGVWVK